MNGPIQDGCDAVITAATSRSSHYPRAPGYGDQYRPEFCGAVSPQAGTARRGTKGDELVRPVLLLDVDGLLNPYAAKPHRRPEGYQAHRLLTPRRDVTERHRQRGAPP